MKRELPIAMTRAEAMWGNRYLLFELVFLGPLVSLGMSLLLPGVEAVWVNFVYFLINFGAVVLIFRQYLLGNLRYTGKSLPKTLMAAGIGFVVYFLLSFIVTFAIQAAVPDFFNVNDAGIAQDSRGHLLLSALGTVVLVPVTEEVLHRGLVFGLLRRRNAIAAYAVSTCLFGFIHIMGYMGQFPPAHLFLCFLQYVPAGLVLAWAYDCSGSIFAPIAIHTAVNALAMLSLR